MPESRLELRNPATAEITVVHLRPEQEKERHWFEDKETRQDLEIADRTPLVEWLAQNYKTFGCKLEFITDRSQEGSQFVKGFGGIGGLLRWKVDFMELNEQLQGLGGIEDEDDFM
jgi:peptide chain release factor subunit 1